VVVSSQFANSQIVFVYFVIISCVSQSEPPKITEEKYSVHIFVRV
jgi:hypothetical protein